MRNDKPMLIHGEEVLGKIGHLWQSRCGQFMAEIERQCDQCGNIYLANLRRLQIGWSKFCDKTCANTARVAHRKRYIPYKRMNSRSKVKEEIRLRDNHTCKNCGLHQEFPRLEVHRIVPEKDGGVYCPENCITVCRSCHKIIEPIK